MCSISWRATAVSISSPSQLWLVGISTTGFVVNGKTTPTEGYVTDHINRFALEFLTRQEKRKPFAMSVGHKAPHGPWEPGPKYKDLFQNEWMLLPKSWNHTYQGRPSYLKARRKPLVR